MSYELFLLLIMIELTILYSSSASGYMLWKYRSSSSAPSYSSRNQYIVSRHSFCAMLSLAIKSFLDCPHKASSMFAPIDVPLRSNWLQSALSQSMLLKYLFIFTILTAKAKAFLATILSISSPVFRFLQSSQASHFRQLITHNSQLITSRSA